MNPGTQRLIIVSGPAASGKTTLAKKLGGMSSIPAVCKDNIKESLFGSLGYETPAWTEKLEVTTYDLLFYMIETILKAGQSVIIESDITADFNEDRINRLKQVGTFDIVQISCRTNGKILIDRFRKRMESSTQHPGHYEAFYLEQSAEFRDSLRQGFSKTLNVDSVVHIVDTTDFQKIDYNSLLQQIIN